MTAAEVATKDKTADFALNLWMSGRLDCLYGSAAFGSQLRVQNTGYAGKLQRLIEKGRVNLFFIVSPPGAGSVFLARNLMEAGQFDACLLEPGAQFDSSKDRFTATLLEFKKAIKSCRKWGPINLLVVEKPQHIAPGAEMDLLAHNAKKILFLSRDPSACLIKRLKIAVSNMADATKDYCEISRFATDGFIDFEADPELISSVSQDGGDLPLSYKIRDYMISNNKYAALCEKSWLINQGVYADKFMQADLSLFRGLVGNMIRTNDSGYNYFPHELKYSWPDEMTECLHAYYWIKEYAGFKFGSDLTEIDTQEFLNFFLRRISGWNALAEFNFAVHHDFRSFYCPEEEFETERKERISKTSNLEYNRFSKDPDGIVKSILENWEIAERKKPLSLNPDSVLSPYGNWNATDTLRISYGRALTGPKEIKETVTGDVDLACLPKFIIEATMQQDYAAYRYFQRLNQL